MGKKEQDRTEDVDEIIISWARVLTHDKPGGLKYRTALAKLELWICLRKGLLYLREAGEI